MDIFNFIILPYECSCQFDLSMLYMSNISIKLNNRNIYFSLSLSLYQKSINCTIVTIVDLSWRRVNHGCHRQVLVLFSKFLLFRSFFLCLFCSCCFSYNMLSHYHILFSFVWILSGSNHALSRCWHYFSGGLYFIQRVYQSVMIQSD